MICPKCGAKLVSGTSVCPICGSKQKISAGPSSATSEARRVTRTPAGERRTEPEKRSRYDDDAYSGDSRHDSDDSYGDSGYDDSGYDSDGYDEPDRYDDGYDDDGNDDYGSGYDDDYEEEDSYEDRKGKKVRGVLIGVIISAVVVIGIMVALIVMLLQKQGGKPDVPQTIDSTKQQASGGIETTDSKTEEQTEEASSEEPSIEVHGKQIKVDNNIYEKNDDGSVTLVEYNSNTSIVLLPSTVGGFPVTAIASHAFKNSKDVQYLKLSGNITQLDTFSLYDLTSLKEVVIPASVTEIKTYAFSHVETCITPEGSFAATHMARIAGKIVYGDSLSVENGTRIPVTPNSDPVPSYTQPTTAPTQPAVQPTQPATQPTQPAETQQPETQPTETQPTEPQPTETQPTEPQPTETQPTEPQPTETQPTEPQPTETEAPVETEESTEEPTETEAPTETVPAETERNAENVKAMIEAASGGAVVDLQYQAFGDSGIEVGFAIVQNADGSRSLWFNSPAGSTQMRGGIGDASGSIVNIGLGQQYLLTGGGTTTLYQSDGNTCSEYVSDLPGNLNPDLLTLNNGSQTGYLTVENGALCEYTAEQVSREQVEKLSGGKDIMDLLTATVGDLSSASFWNRANGMIQVGLADGRYVNLYRVGGGLSLTSGSQITSGTPEIAAGTVAGAMTSLPAITPQPLPTPLTDVQGISENTPAVYDIDGDGADDTIVWSREANADGTMTLVLNINGAECYRTSMTAANYTVELCDLDSSSAGYNLVIYGTGGPNGDFVEIGTGAFNKTMSLTIGSTVLQGLGTFQGIGLNGGHIVSDVSGDGTFTLALASPVAGVSSSTYYVSVPFTAYGEKTDVTEYDIPDLTGAGTMTLVRDVDACTSPSMGTQVDPMPAGTGIAPKKLIYAEGMFFVYVEPQAAYLPVNGDPMY